MKPTERGGPRASNRLDFQKNWTLCHLLELHERGGDYVLVCDYHDDVVVLEPRDGGDGVLHFSQVKSASKQWTLAALLKRGDGKKKVNSILGKLHRHGETFGGQVGSLSMISNERFKLALADGTSGVDRENFRLDEVCDIERTKMLDGVGTEHDLGAPAVFAAPTHFRRTVLTPDAQDTYVRGRLAEFFDATLQKQGVDVIAAHRLLFDEIRLKSNNESLWPDMTDLIAKKGIRRDHLDSMLRRLSSTVDYSQRWLAYSVELAAQGVAIAERVRIEGYWTTYRAARMDETAEAIQQFRDRVCVAAANALRNHPALPLAQLLDRIVAAVGHDTIFVADHVRAAALLEITDNAHPSIQEAHSQPAPEGT